MVRNRDSNGQEKMVGCEEENGSGYIKSLKNGLCLLEILAAQSTEVSNTFLAEQSKLHVSTVFRLLNTLQARHYVTRNPITKGYRLGLAAIHLGEAAKRGLSLVQQTHPYLVKLSEITKENACLTVLADNRSALIDQVSATGFNASPISLGSQTHLYCTASGKVLLAFQSPEFIENYLSTQQLVAFTSNTIVDPEQLRQTLEGIRRSGYAIDDEESWIGIRCIASPVRNYTGAVVASIHIVGHSNRIIPEKFDFYQQHVCDIANQLSYDLGYQSANIS